MSFEPGTTQPCATLARYQCGYSLWGCGNGMFTHCGTAVVISSYTHCEAVVLMYTHREVVVCRIIVRMWSRSAVTPIAVLGWSCVKHRESMRGGDAPTRRTSSVWGVRISTEASNSGVTKYRNRICYLITEKFCTAKFCIQNLWVQNLWIYIFCNPKFLDRTCVFLVAQILYRTCTYTRLVHKFCFCIQNFWVQNSWVYARIL